MSFKTNYLSYLKIVAEDDVNHLIEKEKSYGDSWKKRGGIGAFMVFARKWDRIENMLSKFGPFYDIFAHISSNPTGADSTVLAELRDLRRYLMLVEAEMMARDIVPVSPRKHPETNKPGTPEDGGHHARFDQYSGRGSGGGGNGGGRGGAGGSGQSPSCSGDTR